MAYEMLVERSRRAEREYYETGNPSKYLEKIMYESIDYDYIPDFIDEIDLNMRTTWYRFNSPDEVRGEVIGREMRRYYPLDG